MVKILGDRLAAVGRTDVGCVRTLNEDNFSVDEETNLLIVTDGMGGHDAGEVASARVIELVAARLAQSLAPSAQGVESVGLAAGGDRDDSDDPTLDDIPNPAFAIVREALNLANDDINGSNQAHGYRNGTGMGSTVVGLWFPAFSDNPVIFHVGDSRLYRFRAGKLLQVTRDHSMYQQWVSLGSKGESPAQNILLQAVGPSENMTPDVRFLDLVKGDVVLLCSDGLTGMVSVEKIAEVLRTASQDKLIQACDRLIKMARDGGGRDNITVIAGCVIS